MLFVVIIGDLFVLLCALWSMDSKIDCFSTKQYSKKKTTCHQVKNMNIE